MATFSIVAYVGCSNTPRRIRPSDHSSSGHAHRPESKSFNVELSDLELAKEDLVKVFGNQLETEILKAKYFADEDPVLVPTDVAAVVHSSCQEACRVDELDQCARKHHGAGLVNAAGRLIVQSLMRPLVVEDLPELIKLLLLQPERQCWRLCRVLLQSPMHSLMAPVLLGPTGLNPLMHDAHLHPSKRELRQTQQACPSEWRTVVCSYPRGHPDTRALPRRTPLAPGWKVHPGNDLATNQIAAMSASVMVKGSHLEPSASTEDDLEVHATRALIRVPSLLRKVRSRGSYAASSSSGW